VNQRFTAADTARICAALEAGGVRQIEIGHGFGLGASSERFGIAAASDEEHVGAAAAALRRSAFGAFFIPGIGADRDLDMAREHGMTFVRIGTNVTEHAAARHSIEHARRLGFEVSYNAMKSYLAPPPDLLGIVRDTVEWGAQSVFVVDSAGCLLPAEAGRYTKTLTDSLDVPIGFHGHNNLMMANANCIAAFEAGATVFDGTLQGIGRSGGNAQTEILALTFEKLNRRTGLNVMRLLEAGETLVRPLMDGSGGGSTSLNVIIGMAGFHSSHLGRINAAAQKFGVDPKELILEVCQRDRIDPSQALIDRIASDMTRKASRNA
jgi:4-hydroxy-2-oxovalerate aldolase